MSVSECKWVRVGEWWEGGKEREWKDDCGSRWVGGRVRWMAEVERGEGVGGWESG